MRAAVTANWRSSRTLAILGGTPCFPQNLCVGTPNIGDRDTLMGRLEDVLDRRWLTNNGRYVQELEARIRDHVGARHCVAVTNATAGLELTIRALGLSGEVIVPSFTFVATAHALQWLGIRPVFCDIDPRTHMLDPAQVEALITERTTGILGVHLWGRPCAPDRLSEIARRHGLKLMFDGAHAFGCSSGPTMLGNFGEAEVFSFHATKFLNSLEGGAICTNDDGLAQRLRRMINFGFAGVDRVDCVGTNGKMNEFSAAMGLTSLDSMADFVNRNRRNYQHYRRLLGGMPGLAVLDYGTKNRSNFHYIVVEIDEAELGLSRDEIVAALWAENVLARRYFYPGCHMMEPYRTLEPDAAARLPATEALCQRVMLLPNGTAIDDGQVRMICRLIGEIVAQRRQVRRALAQPAPGELADSTLAAPLATV